MSAEIDSPGRVLVQVDGPVGRIALDDPDRLNPLDAAMMELIADAVEGFNADPRVRVITITGSGRGFCSGARLDAIRDGDTTATLAAVSRVIRTIVEGTKPVVALVNGVAAGVGCSIALACDYVLARESAFFTLGFNKIGLMPDGAGTALVAASIGRAQAMRMALTAERVPASVAADRGLIAEVVADADFDDRGDEVAALLAGAAPQAVAETRRAINAASLGHLDTILEREETGQLRLLAGRDFIEGVAAFNERRPPSFTGE